MTEKQWIELMAPLAVNAMKRYNYRASVMIAQCCQETGYGTTDLAQDDICNVLGMKEELLNDTWLSDYWNYQDVYVKKTPEWVNGEKTWIEDSFRVYRNYQECFYDYCQFMHDAKLDDESYKYRDVLSITDPAELIEAVRKRGYCTDPDYSRAIMAIIKKWDLTKYDEQEEEKKTMTLAERLLQMGIALIDRIKQNYNCGQKHNANTHIYLAIHYLGVNGENPDLYDGCYGGHFYVAKNGTCYQAADVGDILWHVGASSGYRYIHDDARNQNTIGIECATYTASGHNDDDETWYYTVESQQAMAKLAAAIMLQYDIPMSNLLMHGNITTKICPAPYVRDGGKGSNWTWEEFRKKVAGYLGADYTSEAVVEISILRRGNTGDAVRQLQEKLISLGFSCGSAGADASYGTDTEAAVIAFQCAYHLKADGIAGPITLEAIENAIDALEAAETTEEKQEEQKVETVEVNQMYYVQCGAFGSKTNALKKVMVLAGKGWNAIVKDYGSDAELGTRYRVQAGAFINKDRAENMILELKTEGIDAFIRTE